LKVLYTWASLSSATADGDLAVFSITALPCTITPRLLNGFTASLMSIDKQIFGLPRMFCIFFDPDEAAT
jgi:hypothetical protein